MPIKSPLGGGGGVWRGRRTGAALQAESSQPPLPRPTHCPSQSCDFSVSLTGVVWSRGGGGLRRAPGVQLVPCSCSMRASPASLGWRPDGDRPSCCHCPPCPAQGGPESRASPLSQLQLQGRSGAEGTPSLARCRGDRATGIVSSSLTDYGGSAFLSQGEHRPARPLPLRAEAIVRRQSPVRGWISGPSPRAVPSFSLSPFVP